MKSNSFELLFLVHLIFKTNRKLIRDNSKRAYRLIVVFSIIIVVTLLAITSDYLQLNLLEKLANNEYVSEEEINHNDTREGIISIIQSIIYIISVFLFFYWFRRAYANLERAGVKINNDESWAIWGFIVPIISLFKPFQIMKEIWVKTQKIIKKFDKSFDTNYNTVPIILWWILFIGSNIIGRYILKNSFKEDTIESLTDLTKANLISDSIQIIEALLVLFLVTRISKMETTMFDIYKKKSKLVDIIENENLQLENE